MKMEIKKGDLVMIIKGKDKGKTGKVIKTLPKEGRLLIDGLNLIKKIKRPKKTGEKGEIMSVPGPISRANVKVVCPNCKKPTRISHLFENGKKYRQCKICKAKIL
ncbi:MAG TPA: 50S ribosomal protein L24 [Candidatus Paceibacterota bacterium]|nr:50S ribosomal protein L24 [Candidatus Paceibacterota bacterium]HOK97448.1 50S ribosomal protein L24 [Candidatus Paceibacterota bacterium]